MPSPRPPRVPPHAPCASDRYGTPRPTTVRHLKGPLLPPSSGGSGAAITSLALGNGSWAVRGLRGVDLKPTHATNFWLPVVAKEVQRDPAAYVGLLLGTNGVPAGMGFLRCLRLVPAPAEVSLACQAWGSRYTSVPEQLRLQAGLTRYTSKIQLNGRRSPAIVSS